MYFLISNDDGYRAPGIKALTEALSSMGRVAVVAPDRNRSGASNSLTLDNPLQVHEFADNQYFINGTPTDCVHIAITGLLDKTPDMVVSGINAGSNLGDDVIYSGTVAAAMEGRFMGLPALAISLASESGEDPAHYETAALVIKNLIKNLDKSPLPTNTILNINVPDLPYDQIKGMQVTRLGQRHKSEPVIKDKDPRGRPIFWIGPPGGEQDAGTGTDFHAIRQGYVSITPLQIDLTQHSSLDMVSQWLENIDQDE
ncbi:MAG: 5'/3'-nucleotidase SurE [Gammaproteobacteria bacterium]